MSIHKAKTVVQCISAGRLTGPRTMGQLLLLQKRSQTRNFRRATSDTPRFIEAKSLYAILFAHRRGQLKCSPNIFRISNRYRGWKQKWRYLGCLGGTGALTSQLAPRLTRFLCIFGIFTACSCFLNSLSALYQYLSPNISPLVPPRLEGDPLPEIKTTRKKLTNGSRISSKNAHRFLF